MINETIYTAIIGDYDELKDPFYIEDNMDYICFTNQKDLKSNIWNIKQVQNNHMSDVMLARHIKVFPWKYFDAPGVVYWVDAKYQIKGRLRDYKNTYWNNLGMICFSHPDSFCICDELAACIKLGKGEKDSMILQVAHYLSRGYPVDNGLYETACIVRDINNSKIKKIMKEWWNEMSTYSWRDQLSLPYIFWINDFRPDICTKNIRNNEWIKNMGHKNPQK